MLELLAEVAVLEEEVVRLEEQVVNFRQDIYQEAVYMSSRRSPEDLTGDELSSSRSSQPRHSRSSSQGEVSLGSFRLRRSPSFSTRKLLSVDGLSDSSRHCSESLSNGKHPQNDHGLAQRDGCRRDIEASPNSDKEKFCTEKKYQAMPTPGKGSQLKPESVFNGVNFPKIQVFPHSKHS